MNHSLAVFLISASVRAVLATYEAGDDAPRTMFKTFNDDIKVDDYVIVPTTTRHKMTVVKVVEVDVEPDFDSHHDFDWIVGVVDRASFEEIELQEAAAIEKVKSAERRKKRDELGAALATDEAALKELKALPLATHGERVEQPPTTSPE